MEGWSYEDMEKMYNAMPEGSSFMYNMTSEWFVENMLNAQMENFINYDTKEVNLNSDEFINMIEFSKNFKDNKIEFQYQEGEPLNFTVNTMENQLTAMKNRRQSIRSLTEYWSLVKWLEFIYSRIASCKV